MQITGRNLVLVELAIDYALDELHNRIATCPDVEQYADDLAEIDELRQRMRRLGLRVSAAVSRES
jgi:cell fate (sporulation/competence/biofilm development) regulator YmcA (YheA/YmcA/DUF963 family)